MEARDFSRVRLHVKENEFEKELADYIKKNGIVIEYGVYGYAAKVKSQRAKSKKKILCNGGAPQFNTMLSEKLMKVLGVLV